MKKILIFCTAIAAIFTFVSVSDALALFKEPVEGSRPDGNLPVSMSSVSKPPTDNASIDEIIVKFKKNAAARSLQEASARLRSTLPALVSVKQVYQNGGPVSRKRDRKTVELLREKYGFDRTFVVKLSKGEDAKAKLKEIEKDNDVEYAELNGRVELAMVPNDPFYSSSGSWGQDFADLYGHHIINMEQAWDVPIAGGKVPGEGVVVAVIDTGIDYNHPDLWDNVWVNPDLVSDVNGDGKISLDDLDTNHNHRLEPTEILPHSIGYDFAYNDNDPKDDFGHGTHVSGTIAATGNNNLGIVGVAYGAKIMSVKGLYNSGGGYDYILANAVRYACDMGADILSNSWGGHGSSQTITDAFHYANDLGCVAVAAAGNYDLDASDFTPASIDTVITVSATDWNDERASFSNWGGEIDVAAPGVDILSLWAWNTDMYDDGQHYVPPGPNFPPSYSRYYRASGTSMACPHVSGLAALILAQHPGYSPVEVRNALRMSADDLGDPGWDIYFGHGRVNAYNALTAGPPSNGVAHIDSPAFRQSVIGTVPIIGRAADDDFSRYNLFYMHESKPSSLIEICSSTIPIEQGVLCDFDTNSVSDGVVLLRLVVTDSAQRTSENYALFIIDNVHTSFSEPMWSEVGPQEYSGFGASVTSLGDVDGDQIEDFGIGSSSNYAYIYSGATRQIIWTLSAEGSGFGRRVAKVGDIDQDGHADILVSAPEWPDWNTAQGKVYLISGASGLRIREWTGPEGMVDFGYSIAGAGDVNADGVPDIIIGSYRSNRAYVYSGADGSLLWQWISPYYHVAFSYGVAGAGDVNGDGYGDLLVSALGNAYHTGFVQVYSGRTGQLIRRIYGAEGFGSSMARTGDLNMDGHDDIVIGSMWDVGAGGNHAGKIFVYSGFSGELLWSKEGEHGINRPYRTSGDYFGGYVSGGGDFNGDGVPDIIVAAVNALSDGDNIGKVYVYSGRTGALMKSWSGEQRNIGFGTAVSFLRDINFDGVDEILFSASEFDSENAYMAGKVYMFGGHRLVLNPIGNKRISEMQNLNFAVAATGNSPIQFGVSGMSEGATFEIKDDITGVFDWTPTYEQSGIYKVTFTASDGELEDSETITIRVHNVNRVPLMIPLLAQTAIVGQPFTLTEVANDPDQDPRVPVLLSVPALPAGGQFIGMSVRPWYVKGRIEWTPTARQVGTHTIMFIADDQQGGVKRVSVPITVLPLSPSAPLPDPSENPAVR